MNYLMIDFSACGKNPLSLDPLIQPLLRKELNFWFKHHFSIVGADISQTHSIEVWGRVLRSYPLMGSFFRLSNESSLRIEVLEFYEDDPAEEFLNITHAPATSPDACTALIKAAAAKFNRTPGKFIYVGEPDSTLELTKIGTITLSMEEWLAAAWTPRIVIEKIPHSPCHIEL